ncbi:MAG TPA: NAD(P)-dependent oxidoreductase [Solirubrobacteraceae bacterium]|nr:NAD(P)-dependent oxidoreductase [Solirubrobacteraceae bacterium]
MTMHVFVAGATGVIGRRVVALLVERGDTVTAMTRRPDAAERLRSLGARPMVADAYDGAGLRAAMEQDRPDVVMHQLTDLSASDTAANAALRTEGTRNLVDAARAAGVARIVAQSVAWAYEPGETPADESVALEVGADEPRRTTVLGVAALEDAVREVPEWVVLRYGLLYGPDTWFAPDGARAEDARAGRLVADAAVTSFVHVDDAANAAVAALAWPSGNVNVCDDEPAAGTAWVPVFCAAVGAPAPPADPSARPPWARGASNARARRALGWEPRYPSWRSGLGA